MNVPKKFDEQKMDLAHPHVAIGFVKVGKIETRSISVVFELDSFIKQNISISLSYHIPRNFLYSRIIGLYPLILSCKIRNIMFLLQYTILRQVD